MKMKIYLNDSGHMVKRVAMPIYVENPSKIFFAVNGKPISTKLGMLHRGFLPIIVYSTDDHGVTLTYFTAWSKVESL